MSGMGAGYSVNKNHGLVMDTPSIRSVDWISKNSCFLMHTVDSVMQMHKVVRGDRDSRAILMPIYGDLYQIKL